MGAPTIKTGLNTFFPMRSVCARNGDIFFFTGTTRPQRWDGIAAATWDAGVDAPSTAPSIALASGGSATAGVYTYGYRYVDITPATGNFPTGVPSNLVLGAATVTASANQKFNWSALAATLQTTRVLNIELYRSLAGESQTLYRVATITSGTTTYSDTLSDATLATNYALPYVLPDGSPNAVRFNAPPDFCPYVVQLQDRLLACGGVRYTAGTATTHGNTSLTGSGTAWTAQMVGRFAYVTGETAPLKISAFVSATSLTLATSAATTASGLSYAIAPDPQWRNTIFYSESDEPESWFYVTTDPEQPAHTFTVQDNTGDNDEITGIVVHGVRAYVLKERHIYSVQFIRQPNIDAACFLVDDRGAFSDRCVAWHEDLMYIMDGKGVYSFDGQSAKSVSDDIADFWQQRKLDLSVSKWFWACSDHVLGIVYFGVSFAGDSSTRPTRALIYHVGTGQWTTDQYIWEVGGACLLKMAGVSRLLVGAEHDLVLVTASGTADIVATATTGTATSATTNTLVDSGAPFTSDMVDAPVSINAGTGYGQTRRIQSRSTTTLTLTANWTTTPDATSKYIVGGIPWNHRSGMLEFPESDTRTARSIGLDYNPTAHDNFVYLAIYKGYSPTPVSFSASQNLGTGITATAGDNSFIVSTGLNRSTAGIDNGHKSIVYSGQAEPRSQAERWVSVNLSGIAGKDQVTLYSYEFVGAAI